MKKIFSLFLSLFALLSSINSNLSTHYCGQKLIDISLFGNAEKCEMKQKEECQDSIPLCCNDQEILIDGNDHLALKKLSKNRLDSIDILQSEIYYSIVLLRQVDHRKDLANFYIPPLAERKVPALHQSFLL